MASSTRAPRLSLPSPTLETLVVITWVYVGQLAAATAGIGPETFVLRLPVRPRPWTLITTVYAHAGPVHLLANVLVLLPAGLVVERITTRWGFHLLFVVAGVLAAATVVFTGAILGVPIGAIGASGGVFAIVGYGATALPTGGRRSRAETGRPGSPRPGVGGRGIFMLVGLALVVVPIGLGIRPLVTLGHATGFSVGLVVGGGEWVTAAPYRNRSLK